MNIEKILYEVVTPVPLQLRVLEKVNTDYLKEQQKEVFEQVKDLEEPIIVLTGSAGTGKTTLMDFVIRQYLFDHKDKLKSKMKKLLAVTAPTHQAVKILREKCNISSDYMFFATTHSFLGLREQINPDGSLSFLPTGESKASLIQRLIIDEASMIGKELLKLILDAQKQYGFSIVFVGDKKQLPPVGEELSLIFDSNYPNFELTQIIRQTDDNPLKNLIADPSIIIMQDGQQIDTKGWWKLSGEKFKDIVMQFYLHQSYKNDSSFVRILCWTNKWVKYINDHIRREMWGENAERYVVGDRLILKAPYIVDDILILNNNQEVEVVEVSKGMVTYGKENAIDFHAYFLKVSYLDMERVVRYRTIPCLHEDSEKEFEECLDALKKAALSFPYNDYRRSEYWKYFYALKAHFAEVYYAYAQTVHTSQGSTYHNTFIFLDDINKNKNAAEKKKLLYTALTRASNFVFLITK